MGISEHNSYQYCPLCKCKGIYSRHAYCPLQSPADWPDQAFDHNLNNLELRSDEEYREGLRQLDYSYSAVPPRALPDSGVTQYSSFCELFTIHFPRSFPIDIMHLVFVNVLPKLFRWWTGDFLNKSDDTDEEDEEGDNIRLSDTIWKQIGEDMANSRSTISSSYGRAL